MVQLRRILPSLWLLAVRVMSADGSSAVTESIDVNEIYFEQFFDTPANFGFPAEAIGETVSVPSRSGSEVAKTFPLGQFSGRIVVHGFPIFLALTLGKSSQYQLVMSGQSPLSSFFFGDVGSVDYTTSPPSIPPLSDSSLRKLRISLSQVKEIKEGVFPSDSVNPLLRNFSVGKDWALSLGFFFHEGQWKLRASFAETSGDESRRRVLFDETLLMFLRGVYDPSFPDHPSLLLPNNPFVQNTFTPGISPLPDSSMSLSLTPYAELSGRGLFGPNRMSAEINLWTGWTKEKDESVMRLRLVLEDGVELDSEWMLLAPAVVISDLNESEWLLSLPASWMEAVAEMFGFAAEEISGSLVVFPISEIMHLTLWVGREERLLGDVLLKLRSRNLIDEEFSRAPFRPPVMDEFEEEERESEWVCPGCWGVFSGPAKVFGMFDGYVTLHVLSKEENELIVEVPELMMLYKQPVRVYHDMKRGVFSLVGEDKDKLFKAFTRNDYFAGFELTFGHIVKNDFKLLKADFRYHVDHIDFAFYGTYGRIILTSSLNLVDPLPDEAAFPWSEPVKSKELFIFDPLPQAKMDAFSNSPPLSSRSEIMSATSTDGLDSLTVSLESSDSLSPSDSSAGRPTPALMPMIDKFFATSTPPSFSSQSQTEAVTLSAGDSIEETSSSLLVEAPVEAPVRSGEFFAGLSEKSTFSLVSGEAELPNAKPRSPKDKFQFKSGSLLFVEPGLVQVTSVSGSTVSKPISPISMSGSLTYDSEGRILSESLLAFLQSQKQSGVRLLLSSSPVLEGTLGLDEETQLLTLEIFRVFDEETGKRPVLSLRLTQVKKPEQSQSVLPSQAEAAMPVHGFPVSSASVSVAAIRGGVGVWSGSQKMWKKPLEFRLEFGEWPEAKLRLSFADESSPVVILEGRAKESTGGKGRREVYVFPEAGGAVNVEGAEIEATLDEEKTVAVQLYQKTKKSGGRHRVAYVQLVEGELSVKESKPKEAAAADAVSLKTADKKRQKTVKIPVGVFRAADDKDMVYVSGEGERFKLSLVVELRKDKKVDVSILMASDTSVRMKYTVRGVLMAVVAQEDQRMYNPEEELLLVPDVESLRKESEGCPLLGKLKSQGREIHAMHIRYYAKTNAVIFELIMKDQTPDNDHDPWELVSRVLVPVSV